MSDIFLREKEFLKLNSELDVRSKTILEKPIETKVATARKTLSSANKKETYDNFRIKDNSNVQNSSRNSSSLNGSIKNPEISEKPRSWHSKASTIPRENSDLEFSLKKKILRERELMKLNEELNNESLNVFLKDENINEKPTIQRRSISETDSTGITPASCTLSRKSNYSTETYRSHKFSRNPSHENTDESGNKFKQVSPTNDNSKASNRSESRNSVTSSVCSSLSKKPPIPEKPYMKNISSDGLVKFLKSKVSILQTEFDNLQKVLTQKTEELEKCYEIQKKFETQRDHAISKNNSLTGTVSKLEEKLNELEGKLKEREIEFTATSREMEGYKRDMKVLTQNNINLEKRLYRANEELETVKSNLSHAKEAEKQLKDTVRSEKETFERQTKNIRKQKTDLLTAYKKQLYLLDNLKRQNAVLEQARLISFAEKEFTKVLEWNNSGGE